MHLGYTASGSAHGSYKMKRLLHGVTLEHDRHRPEVYTGRLEM